MKTWTCAMMVMTAMLLGTSLEARADEPRAAAAPAAQQSSAEQLAAHLDSKSFVYSRLDLRRHSADPVADLVVIAPDPARGSKVRVRAIRALALYAREDQRAADALTALMASTNPNKPLFPIILLSFGEGLGEQAAPQVVRYIKHKREDVRMAAVVTLGRFGGQIGYDALLARAEQEPSRAVLARINEYIQ